MSTTGTPVSAANRSIACARDRSPRPRWCTTSSASCPGPNTDRQADRRAAATSARPAVRARPTGESGPSSATSPSGCSAASASEATGSPRVPRRWVALVSRHSDRQPAPSRARKVTRGRRGSTLAPPRAGDRRATRPTLTLHQTVRVGRRRTAGAVPRPGDPRRSGAEGVRQRRGHAAVDGGGDREVDPEQRPDVGRPAGERELDRAVEAVAVGQRQRLHAVLGGAGDQVGRVVGPVAHGVARGDVQVDEGVAAHRPGAGGAAGDGAAVGGAADHARARGAGSGSWVRVSRPRRGRPRRRGPGRRPRAR